MSSIMMWLFIILGIIVISILWSGLFGAPWVPTAMDDVHKMLTIAGLQPNEVIYDLGCGDGRLIVTAATKYKARGVGIEIDPLRYLYCQLLITILGLRSQVKILYGNFFNKDLSQADVVTCYLLPDTNKKLEDKLLRELRPGTRVVSNTFLFNKVKVEKKEDKVRLYLFSPQNTLVESIKEQLKSSSQKSTKK